MTELCLRTVKPADEKHTSLAEERGQPWRAWWATALWPRHRPEKVAQPSGRQHRAAQGVRPACGRLRRKLHFHGSPGRCTADLRPGRCAPDAAPPTLRRRHCAADLCPRPAPRTLRPRRCAPDTAADLRLRRCAPDTVPQTFAPDLRPGLRLAWGSARTGVSLVSAADARTPPSLHAEGRRLPPSWAAAPVPGVIGPWGTIRFR